MKKCQVTAEIGCTHLASVKRGKELIRLAKLSGADCVKFQKRHPVECVPDSIQEQPHPNKLFAYGDTYLKHRENLELDIEQHKDLQKYCNDIGIGYSISVFDLTSAKEVITHLNPVFIKVPSACNNNYELINMLFDTDIDLHISLGMSSKDEISNLISYLEDKILVPGRVLLYHCTSEYPCPFEHLYLKEISKLKERIFPTCRIGFSNHGFGIAADIAAYILGAEWIERHFIDDRTIPHTDAAASLEPDGLRRLCRDLNAVYKAMGFKSTLSESEIEQRKKLRIEH